LLQFCALFYQSIWLRRSVRVAERALTELERPYVFWENIQTDITSFLSPQSVWDEARQGPAFRFSVINHGRTAGGIDSATIIFEVRTTEPSNAAQGEFVVGTAPEAAEMIVGPTNPFTFPEMRCIHPFTFDHREAINAGDAWLFCYGGFNYTDIFREAHQTIFCRRYDARRREWTPIGGRERNNSN
jgi:hypothetical protein